MFEVESVRGARECVLCSRLSVLRERSRESVLCPRYSVLGEGAKEHVL